MDFTTRYQSLNINQKTAVDTIDGPVMVIAGPGTGKTELLGMRAANILKKTDTLPENILCLTFTESGAHAMRERLASIIGKDAYKVAIHTFHSFGTEVINHHSEFFYHGAHFRPADELSSYQIIQSILDELDYTNPLASKMNGEYTHLRDITSCISELKRSGLTSDELLQVLDSNDAVLDASETMLRDVFAARIGATTLARLVPVSKEIANIAPPPLPANLTPLSNVMALSLAHAVDQATDDNSTKPITAWKNHWMEKDSNGRLVFKTRKRHDKLRSLSYVYFQYLTRMQEAELYDYDDMILRVVHAMEVFDDLRFNLQEKYQYIMVDEFQDTSLAQMRILDNLTNNPAQEDTPNILVVGDDDQAIYSFQGADVSNILSFRSRHPKARLIALVDNYRSSAPILDAARTIITQGDDRLERYIEELDKTLIPHHKEKASVLLFEAATASDERAWLVNEIKTRIDRGEDPSQIAVLARRHHEIIALLPYFATANIPVIYERRDNVFDLAPIVLVEQLARVITLLGEQKLQDADALLPELLAHPAWEFTPSDLWKLSVSAYDGRTRWIDTMATMPHFTALHTWLIEQVTAAKHQPLEHMLDSIIGVPSEDGDAFRSPLYAYFFGKTALADNPDNYLTYLEALRTIRTAIREYHSDTEPTLATFVSFIDLYRQTGGTLTSIRRSADNAQAVNLMSAHKSKGLEFKTVFITGAVDTTWGERVRGKSRNISYPENLPISPAGDSADERLRLFFVAATRARQDLVISYAAANDDGKPLERAGFLLPLGDAAPITHASDSLSSLTLAKQQWYTHLSTPSPDLRTLLAPMLERYKLSATHLGNFLDVTRGGPQMFLLNNLLRFPQRMSPAAMYGSAIHATLQRAHAHLTATGKHRALEDILHDFETILADYHLSTAERDALLQQGTDTLQAFLAAKYDTFTPGQKAELSFAGQQSVVGEAHLTGNLDLIDINQEDRTITVTDYKTGHPARDWKGRTDYEKAKLHRYRQQLMFYKLLVEHSRDYGTYSVNRGILQFVEPSKDGQIVALEDDFAEAELDEFRRLLDAVWRKITALELPDIEGYETSYKGILAFERDLIDGNA